MGRRLASLFAANGIPVLLLDRNSRAVREAQEAGFDAVCGDALDPDLPYSNLQLAAVGNVLCATDNEAINKLIARQL